MRVPPDRFRPQLAQLVKRVPEGPDWFHEIKYDGYRIGCRADRGKVTLYSRNNRDWTTTFPEVAAAARALPATNTFLDGEVAVVLPDGRTSFQALQNAIGNRGGAGLVYFVFDLLFLDGEDLGPHPLEQRKQRLRALLDKAPAPLIRYSDHVVGNGVALFEHACRLKLEGIVSKRSDLPYQAGRHDSWVKTKCVNRQELVIGGFTDPEGSRVGIGALLVGYYDEGGRLIFAGKVGTGFTNRSSVEMRTRLEALARDTTPFAAGLDTWLARHAHWARPELVAEVTFTEWTDEGKIRHPSYQGLRVDKAPASVHREQPLPAAAEETPHLASASAKGPARRRAPAAPSERRGMPAAPANKRATRGAARSRGSRGHQGGDEPEAGGVRISHPERVMYPQLGLTKLDVARYYEAVADRMLPHLRGRPLTLVRCGEGLPTGVMRRDCIYMKHSKVWAPEALRRVRIRERTKIGEYVIADSVAGLLSLVQMDVLEIHTWNSIFERVEEPDRLVFDIDPGPEVEWPWVVEGARLVRSVLQTLGLESYVKTTGGAGLHVVVPIAPSLSWNESLQFSRAVAEAIVRTQPARYTTSFPKAGRERKLLVDYLRNNRTNTSIAAFSTRARPGATVSFPIAWDDLTPRLRPGDFTVQTVPGRLARQKRDPWEGYWKSKQKIGARAMKAVAAL